VIRPGARDVARQGPGVQPSRFALDAELRHEARDAVAAGRAGLLGDDLAEDLRRGIVDQAVDDAAAAIFALGQPETYRALVVDGGWDDSRWAAWVQAALVAALLGPRSG